jgi:hypothetical protein
VSIKTILATGVLAASVVSVAAAQQMITPGQYSSNYNIAVVRHRVEGLIDQLGRDRHDYGGHKATAMADLQAARHEMMAAEQFARNHGY